MTEEEKEKYNDKKKRNVERQVNAAEDGRGGGRRRRNEAERTEGKKEVEGNKKGHIEWDEGKVIKYKKRKRQRPT